MMLWTPSYDQGFAPRDYEPEYPEFWDAVALASMPSLGPTGSELPDWSGRGSKGALSNFTLSSAWANPSLGLTWNGSTSYVDFGTKTAIQPIAAGCITVWVYCTSFADYRTVVSWANMTTDRNGVNFYLHVTSGNIRAEICDGSGGSVNGNGTAGAVSLNTLTLIGFQWDGITQSYWKNGTQVYSMSQTKTPTNGTYPTLWGGGSGPTLYGFAGSMNDMQIINRTRTAGEHAMLYNMGPGGIYAPSLRRSIYIPSPSGTGSIFRSSVLQSQIIKGVAS